MSQPLDTVSNNGPDGLPQDPYRQRPGQAEHPYQQRPHHQRPVPTTARLASAGTVALCRIGGRALICGVTPGSWSATPARGRTSGKRGFR